MIQNVVKTPVRPKANSPVGETNVTCVNSEHCPVSAPLMVEGVEAEYRVVPVKGTPLKAVLPVVGPIVLPQGNEGDKAKDTIYWQPKKPTTVTGVKVCQIDEFGNTIDCKNVPLSPPKIEFERPITKVVTYTVDPTTPDDNKPDATPTKLNSDMCKRNPSVGVCQLTVTDKADETIQSQYHPGELIFSRFGIADFSDSNTVVVRKPLSTPESRDADNNKPFVAIVTGPFNPEGRKIMNVAPETAGKVPG